MLPIKESDTYTEVVFTHQIGGILLRIQFSGSVRGMNPINKQMLADKFEKQRLVMPAIPFLFSKADTIVGKNLRPAFTVN